MVKHSNQRRNIVGWVFAVTTLPTTATEQRLLLSGHHFVVGIDEVGKGAWAGPLVIGVAVLTNDVIPVSYTHLTLPTTPYV